MDETDAAPLQPAAARPLVARDIARLLIIAGSDSGGGAGIQADLKAGSAMGVYTATALTAITAQNTRGVQAVEVLSPALVAAQIASVLDDIGADAVKLGMLASEAVIAAVAEALQGYDGPLVLDPVMIAKSGDALLPQGAVAALRRDLMPRTTLLTPNLPEAACLLDQPVARSLDEATAQGHALRALGPEWVLMKGGHAEGPLCTDLLIGADSVVPLSAPRQSTRNTHGTGCSFASAIAAGLAQGLAPDRAFARAHGWLQGAIAAADQLQIGAGHGPVHHFHALWAQA